MSKVSFAGIRMMTMSWPQKTFPRWDYRAFVSSNDLIYSHEGDATQ